jgi:hypothetical protein
MSKHFVIDVGRESHREIAALQKQHTSHHTA